MTFFKNSNLDSFNFVTCCTINAEGMNTRSLECQKGDFSESFKAELKGPSCQKTLCGFPPTRVRHHPVWVRGTSAPLSHHAHHSMSTHSFARAENSNPTRVTFDSSSEVNRTQYTCELLVWTNYTKLSFDHKVKYMLRGKKGMDLNPCFSPL